MKKYIFCDLWKKFGPLYDVIIGGQNVQKSLFSTKIDHFSTNLNKTWYKHQKWKNANFGDFWPNSDLSLTS